jgi:hypothetical protein
MHSRSTLMIISSWCHSRRSLLTAEVERRGACLGTTDNQETRRVQDMYKNDVDLELLYLLYKLNVQLTESTRAQKHEEYKDNK